MNERIRELAERAGFKLIRENCYDVVSTMSVQEFAELIVRECAGILLKPEYAMNHPEELGDYNEGWVNGRLLGIEHIKEHFGVEE